MNNDEDHLSLFVQLDSIYNSCSISRFSPHWRNLTTQGGDAITTTTEAVLVQLIKALGADLKLFAVVGSAGLGRAAKNWSDLDILIIMNPEHTATLRQAVLDLGNLSVTVGLTILTPAEINNLIVEAKIIHVLQLLKQGRLEVLHAANDYVLPDLCMEDDVLRSWVDLPRIIHALRRETLNREPNARKLYKCMILVAKIVLRVNRVFLEDEDEIVRNLNDIFESASFIRIPYRLDAISGNVGPLEMVAVATAFLGWYENLMSKSVAVK